MKIILNEQRIVKCERGVSAVYYVQQEKGLDMKRIQRLILLQLKLFLLWQFADIPSALASDDWRYWNEFQLKHSIKNNLVLRLKAEQRLRDDFTDLFMNNYEVLSLIHI